MARTGTVELLIDDAAVRQLELPLLMTVISSVGPSVGYDHGSAVSDRYRGAVPVLRHAATASTSTPIPTASTASRPTSPSAELRAETARQ